MSNIDKQAVQAVADLKAGYTLGHADIAMLKSMARHLLARLEQEPVYQACKEAGVWVDIEPGDVDSLKANGEQVRALYAAPQLSQSALLDELEAKDRRNAELNSTLERWAADRAQSASELDDADKQIAELSQHLQSAHEFIEHTEAFGHEASNGILCCGDAQWNIDASKATLSASGINGEG